MVYSVVRHFWQSLLFFIFIHITVRYINWFTIMFKTEEWIIICDVKAITSIYIQHMSLYKKIKKYTPSDLIYCAPISTFVFNPVISNWKKNIFIWMTFMIKTIWFLFHLSFLFFFYISSAMHMMQILFNMKLWRVVFRLFSDFITNVCTFNPFSSIFS